MSRVMYLAATALLLVGCPRAIRLELDTPETSAARVSARLVKGTKAPVPDTCDLPCGVSVEPDTKCEITVTAPGYYPAIMSVAYEQMLGAASKNAARLVVPLVKRPERGTAAGGDPDTAAPGLPGDAALPGGDATAEPAP